MTSTTKVEKFHLNGLDTLRAIAALSVIFYHIELIKITFNLTNLTNFAPYEETGGRIGVVLFFVISGFLITILLLREKNTNSKINFKNFYLRRIFRIWPLYYLILFLSSIIFDYRPDFSILILCLTIFPNIATSTVGLWETSPQIWSLGVEEQFYLVWPLIINGIKKNTLFKLVMLTLLLALLPHFISFTLIRTYPDKNLISILEKIFYRSKFHCMSIGGVAAVLFIEKRKILNYFQNKNIRIVFVIIPFVLWYTGASFGRFTEEIYAMLFSLMVLSVSLNQTGSVNIDTKVSTFLGKISYGLYMYHWIVLLLCINFLKDFISTNVVLGNILLYISVTLFTILISYLSYTYYESYFLKLKKKYSNL